MRENTRAWSFGKRPSPSCSSCSGRCPAPPRRRASGFDGIPNPLLALLTKTCASCGHQSVNWVGSIAQEEERVAEAEQQIPYDRQRLDTALQRAEALLAAETVSV